MPETKLISLRLNTQNTEDLQQILNYLQNKTGNKPTQTEAIRFALRQLAKSINHT